MNAASSEDSAVLGLVVSNAECVFGNIAKGGWDEHEHLMFAKGKHRTHGRA